MINSTGESKSKLIGRRMFIISAAKAVVVFGILGRLVSLQINESKKYKTLSDDLPISIVPKWKLLPIVSLDDSADYDSINPYINDDYKFENNFVTVLYKQRSTKIEGDFLSFSTDTLVFDTVFTTVGSATRYLKIYLKILQT